jgi:archaemetzincin
VRLKLVPLQPAPAQHLEALRKAAQLYQLEAAHQQALHPPVWAWDPVRRQFDAQLILEELGRQGFTRLTLAYTGADLYVPGLNFVFGLAAPEQGLAVVSIHRLKTPDTRLLGVRVFKEAAHELGHLLGLAHCPNPCLMRFSNSLWEVDRKPATLCPRCVGRLKGRVIK